MENVVDRCDDNKAARSAQKSFVCKTNLQHRANIITKQGGLMTQYFTYKFLWHYK